MGKQKISPEKMAKALAQPTIYQFTLKEVSTANYDKALNMLKQNAEYAAIEERRNKLVQASDRLRPGSSEMQSLLQQVVRLDSKLAAVIFSTLVQVNSYSKKTDENLNFSTLQKYFVDYSDSEKKRTSENLSVRLKTIMFLADYLSSVITDLKGDMIDLFGPEIQFNQFNLVQETLRQLDFFFNSTQNADCDSPAQRLFIEYADSINAYLNKRFKTYVEKYNKIHPPLQIYTEQDMIEGVKQVFGENSKFDNRIIGHTESNGSYISFKALAGTLNAEQTVILERLTKHFSKEECKSFDSETLLSFRLTDAVMLNFKRIVKN